MGFAGNRSLGTSVGLSRTCHTNIYPLWPVVDTGPDRTLPSGTLFTPLCRWRPARASTHPTDCVLVRLDKKSQPLSVYQNNLHYAICGLQFAIKIVYNAFQNNELIGRIRGDWIMEQSKPVGAIVQELDELYVMLRRARYANALNDAKKCFQEKNYPETLRLVRETGELHRRMHLHVIKQDPQKAGGKKEAQKLLEKQAKLNDSLERFGKLIALLEKMARLSAEKSTAPVSARPRQAEQIQPADAGEAPIEEQKSQATWLIDAGTFSQLQTAAQQTGLIANADAIGFVRDHEFRTGMYQQAFDRIEGLAMHMRSAAEQRAGNSARKSSIIKAES